MTIKDLKQHLNSFSDDVLAFVDRHKDCKHSVRFDAKPEEKEPALISIYVSKPLATAWKEVTVTLEGK